MVCWNLPVLQRKQLQEWDEHRRHFDSVIAASPEPVGSTLLGLVESRKTTFAQVPFMVLVEVRGTSLDNCTIYAEARGDGPGQLVKQSRSWPNPATPARARPRPRRRRRRSSNGAIPLTHGDVQLHGHYGAFLRFPDAIALHHRVGSDFAPRISSSFKGRERSCPDRCRRGTRGARWVMVRRAP